MADRVTDTALRQLIGASADTKPLTSCPELNASVCELSSKGSLSSYTVVVYNPMGRARDVVVRLPTAETDTDTTISVTAAASSKRISSSSAVLPAGPVSHVQARGLPVGSAKKLLVFQAQMPGLSARAFTVHRRRASKEPVAEHKGSAVNDHTLDNDHVRVEFSQSTGLIKSLLNKHSGLRVNLTQSFRYYVADGRGKTDGAYMFSPNANLTNANGSNIPCVGLNGRCHSQTAFYHTAFVSEAHQTFSNWTSQVVRLYHNATALELEYTIGPVPIADGLGKEVVSRLDTDISSGELFSTDANGFEMAERIRNHRATFKLNLTEPQAANLYPINSALTIRDATRQLTITPDRCQGGMVSTQSISTTMIPRDVSDILLVIPVASIRLNGAACTAPPLGRR